MGNFLGPYLLEKEKWAQDVKIDKGKMHKILGLKPDQKISDFGSALAAVKKLIKAVGEKKAAGMINYAANLTDDPFLDQMQKELKKI